MGRGGVCRSTGFAAELFACFTVVWLDSVLFRRGGGGLVVDELPGGNHRRGRAGATPGGGAYGAYRCATNGGGGVGTGPHGQRRHRAYVATFRFGKVQPSSPSACRAAASRSVRHSAWHARET